MKWKQKHHPLRELTSEESKRSLKMTVGKLTKKPCFFCDEENGDYCFNCERPICEKHSKPMVFIQDRFTGEPMFVLNVCLECYTDYISEHTLISSF